MIDEPHGVPDPNDLTSFVSRHRFILGVGETVEDARAAGEWVATDAPVEVRC